MLLYKLVMQHAKKKWLAVQGVNLVENRSDRGLGNFFFNAEDRRETQEVILGCIGMRLGFNGTAWLTNSV